MEIRRFGKYPTIQDVPSLTDIQVQSYAEFQQADKPFNRRVDSGLEAILRETFPIHSYDKTMSLQYVGYELGRPRYTEDECRVLSLTYGSPFRIRVRLEKPDPVVGDMSCAPPMSIHALLEAWSPDGPDGPTMPMHCER